MPSMNHCEYQSSSGSSSSNQHQLTFILIVFDYIGNTVNLLRLPFPLATSFESDLFVRAIVSLVDL